MRTIAIVLGDNDFGKTFKPLLETLATAIIHRQSISESDVKSAISSGIEFHYRMFQRDQYKAEEYTFKILKYLQSKVQVLFDEEAEDNFATHDYDGGAWYLDCLSGSIYSY